MARSSPTPQGLPRELTTFVGRRRELREVKEALSSTALLTLIGPAGVGKTRLALRTAADLGRGIPQGAWMVGLADLRDPALVAQAAADALGFRDTSSRWLVSSLAEFLAPRHLLLVLDNCEHLVDSCAVLVDSLLRYCPNLKVLATSREPLGVGGEALLPVEPLSVPVPEHGMPTDALVQYEAVRLFVEHARAVSPGFGLTSENGRAVAALCRSLDGIPLAIELAAVRMRALPVEEILSQLDDRFGLLTTGSRTASPRQQTLRGAIEWSYGLLAEQERTVWRRLSLFAGGFEMEMAQDLCSDTEIPRDRVLGLVAGLVDKSVVMRVQGSPGRYRMLETIREFGRERLVESGEEPTMRRRHRDLFMSLAREARKRSWGSDQVEWWQRTSVELPNFREALRYCLTTPGEARRGLALASDVFYWGLDVREGRRWLDELLELDHSSTPQRAMALASSAHMAFHQLDFSGGTEKGEAGRSLAVRLHDDELSCFALWVLGHGALLQQKLEEATSLLREARALAERLDDRRNLAMVLNTLGAVMAFRGDSDQAIELCQESSSISVEIGDRYFKAAASFTEAVERWKLGEFDLAESLASECIDLHRRFGDKFQVGISVEAVAWIAMSRDDGARGVSLMGGAQRLFEESGTKVYPPWTLYHESCVRKGRAQLGDTRFDRLFQAGRDASIEETILLALHEEPAPVLPHGAKPRRVTDLTPRESEIAGLVARGMSNKAIASHLFISQRTAETHVEHILTKLGFTSRVQIAAWAVEHEALGEDPTEA